MERMANLSAEGERALEYLLAGQVHDIVFKLEALPRDWLRCVLWLFGRARRTRRVLGRLLHHPV
jgi:hypothetical protein